MSFFKRLVFVVMVATGVQSCWGAAGGPASAHQEVVDRELPYCTSWESRGEKKHRIELKDIIHRPCGHDICVDCFSESFYQGKVMEEGFKYSLLTMPCGLFCYNEIDILSEVIERECGPVLRESTVRNLITLMQQKRPELWESVRNGLVVTVAFSGGRKARQSLLGQACFRGRLEVIRVLLDAGCDPFLTDSEGLNALHRSIIDEKPLVAELLLARYPSLAHVLNLYQCEGFEVSPLCAAAEIGLAGIVDLLVDTYKADPRFTLPSGQDALAIAASYGHEAIVRKLLSLGKVSAPSQHLAIRYAEKNEHWNIVQLLCVDTVILSHD